MVRILGIETSCDETGVGIVQDGREILANVVASSERFHRPYGGVVPEIAARVHVEVIWPVVEEALSQAALRLEDLDAIAVTQGPGLPTALLIGVAFAKGLALSLDRPLIGVDHLAAHLYAGEMVQTEVEPPYVGLIVSGGHTLLCLVYPDQRYEVLGETQDDAVGEAFDKVAKLLGLGYPGGPAIDTLSDQGSASAVPFPRSHSKEAFDFSFSGLKTAVYNHVRGLDEPPDAQRVADIAASFQATAVDVLVAKTLKACQRSGLSRVVVGGGVAANRRLRQRLTDEGQAKKIQVVFPTPKLCVDNGAMVAGAAYPLLRRGRTAPLAMNADSNLHLVA